MREPVKTTFVVDLDGPILDGRQRHYHCYRDILAGIGFEPLAIEHYWALKRDRVDRRRLLSLSNASAAYDQFLAAWMERIEAESYLSLDRLQPGVREILAAWKDQGIRMVLATMRNNPEGVRSQLDRFGISSLLDDVLTIPSQLGAQGKARAVEAALGPRHGNQVVWIGDTEFDFDASRQIGAKACLLACGLRSRQYLHSLDPDVLEDDLGSFARSGALETWLAGHEVTDEH